MRGRERKRWREGRRGREFRGRGSKEDAFQRLGRSLVGQQGSAPEMASWNHGEEYIRRWEQVDRRWPPLGASEAAPLWLQPA